MGGRRIERVMETHTRAQARRGWWGGWRIGQVTETRRRARTHSSGPNTPSPTHPHTHTPTHKQLTHTIPVPPKTPHTAPPRTHIPARPSACVPSAGSCPGRRCVLGQSCAQAYTAGQTAAEAAQIKGLTPACCCVGTAGDFIASQLHSSVLPASAQTPTPSLTH